MNGNKNNKWTCLSTYPHMIKHATKILFYYLINKFNITIMKKFENSDHNKILLNSFYRWQTHGKTKKKTQNTLTVPPVANVL